MEDYDDGIELNILSCLFLHPKLFEEIMITEKNFIKHKEIFVLFKKIYLKYKNLDSYLLLNETNKSGNIFDFVSNLVSDYSLSIESFHSYEEKQLEIYKEYKIKEFSIKLEQHEISLRDFIDKINELNLENISLESNKTTEEILNLIMTQNDIIKFEKMKELEQKVKFIKNTFNIIAARPSTGKSAFALNMLEDLSKNYNCLYFNMEMTEKDIYRRLVSINTSIPIDSLTQPSKNQLNLMKQSIQELVSRKIKIINGSKSIQAMKSIIVKEQKKGHLLVFIDYVGYIVSSDKIKSDREKIGAIVREIQSLTTDYDITVFCVAQINREGTDEPTEKNLKDTGELEQSGHAIIIIHNTSADPIMDQDPTMKIKVVKNRSGRKGYFEMKYIKKTQQFLEPKKTGINAYISNDLDNS